MEIEEILINANIPSDWWEYCYISNNNQIYTPIFDIENKIIKTGEEYYKLCDI